MDQNSSTLLATRILALLQENGGSSAYALSRELSPCTREEVNRSLYCDLLKRGKVAKDTSKPPRWTPLPPQNTRAQRRLVVVDLGNTHDCLRELLPYAATGSIEVRAYADLAYNGFGVSPPLTDAPGVCVKQATTADKNAADVDMIWDLAGMLSQGDDGPCYFVVVATKDQGFRRLKALVDSRGHRLEFVTGWGELRHYVE